MNIRKLNAFSTFIGIIVVLLTFFWGVYTFIYKDVIQKEIEPISLKMSIEIDKNFQESNITNLDVNRLTIKLENPGVKEADLLASVFYINAYLLTENKNSNSLEKITIDTNTKRYYSKIVSPIEPDGSLIYWGGIFDDDSIKPNEELSRTISFYFDKKKFNYFEIQGVTYFSNKGSNLSIEITPVGNGKFKTIIKDHKNLKEISNDEINKLNVKSVSCSYEIGI